MASNGRVTWSGFRCHEWLIALLLLGVVACDTSSSTGGRAAQGTHRASVESSSWSPLTVDDLRLSSLELSRGELQNRFAVSRGVAERWALNRVMARQVLSGTPSICFYLPVRNGAEELIAHQLIITDLAACSTFGDLRARTEEINDRARQNLALAVSGSEPTPDEVRERARLSGEHFYTVSVSAHSFRHPLRDGVSGLPIWAVALDQLPARCSDCAPVASYPVGDAAGLVEVVEYRSAGGGLLYSHYRAREVQPDELPVFQRTEDDYERWRAAVMHRYGEALDERIAAQNALWNRYLTLEGQ